MNKRLHILAWILAALPLATSTVALIALRQNAVENGRTFARGLHFFGWIVPYGCAWIFFLVCSMALALVLLRLKKLIIVMVILPLISVLILLSIPTLVAGSFRAARDEAYGRLDLAALHKACLKAYPEILAKQPREIQEFEEEFATLPEAIRVLRPMFVAVSSDWIILQIDGGGIAGHEGLAVVLSNRKSQTAPGIRRLSPDAPVFLYRLYDYRQFEDSLK